MDVFDKITEEDGSNKDYDRIEYSEEIFDIF